ncbi:MAG: hypothetical protein R3B40_26435 [Polyangiales bacterium]
MEFPHRPDVTFDIATRPKAELHCHIDGLLSPRLLRRMARQGHAIGAHADRLAAIHPVDGVAAWVERYLPLVNELFTPKDVWLPIILTYHLEELIAQHTVYAEIFVSNLLFARPDEAQTVDLFASLRRLVDVTTRGRMVTELVVCIGRGGREKVAPQVPRILALAEAGLVCGVAVAGPNESASLKPMTGSLDEFRRAGLPIEVHAGEFEGPEAVWDALEFGEPRRIGHGVSAFRDPALVRELVDRGIHLEFCPTSNVKLGNVRRVEDLPIRAALDAGVSFSVNTDDPGAFECTLTGELTEVASRFDLNDRELDLILDDTLRAAFGAAPSVDVRHPR